MYHYDPVTALDELREEALLPTPVQIRDMMARAEMTPEQSLEVNRKFKDYLHTYGEAQSLAKAILDNLAA